MNNRLRTGTISFRPRARLLKLIGEELISDDVVAISELVKNAHDADALTVIVSFRGVTGKGGVVEVRDDGFGMDLDTLLSRWMEPASSTKVEAARKVTPRGRRVLGEKGVGRFAADKIAQNLEIISRCKGSPDEIRAVIDWNLYDDGDRMLEEVKNRWELRTAREIQKHGMVLRMAGLRAVWNERMFRRLSIRLGRLLSPFRERDHFTIRMDSDEFPEYSGELRSDILDKAPYRIDARFDGRQTITLSTGRMRSIQQQWNGHGELSCGPVRIRMFAFDLEGEAVARIGPRMEVRAWLKEWSGVSIYRDGFRIWPYGEPHDDWLRLDQRRVNNPVEHLSNNQVIGFLDINRDGNPDLIDQTNREGLMNNRAFDDLRRLAYFVLQILEAERQSLRHPVKRVSPSMNGSESKGEDSFRKEIESIAERAGPELGRDLRRLGDKFQERLSAEKTQQVHLISGYSGLAAIGQMATGFLSDLSIEFERIQENLQAIRRTMASANGHAQPIQQVTDSLSLLADRFQLLQLVGGSTDRRRAIDLVAELKTFKASIETLLEAHEIRMEVDFPQGEVLRTEMRPEHFHCLMQILTLNSIDWLGQAKLRRIRVILSGNDEDCGIIFSDNGPGIPAPLWARVFEPQFSLKEGGRGMGLTIARQLVGTHGGYIHVLLDGRRKGGNIEITLPRKRSRATFHNGR